MKQQTGNLLEVEEGILVHGCNAQGVMASGVAKAVRERYPQAFAVYRKAYEAERAAGRPHLTLGRVVWLTVSTQPKLAVANAITQKFYGRNPNVRYADYDAIQKAFRRIGQVARQHQLPVHYPLIGAGLANGDWAVISAIINEELEGVAHTLWTLPGAPRPGAGIASPAPR